MRQRGILAGALILGALATATNAQASELITHVQTHKLASRASVKVNSKKIAMLTYVAKGRVHHVLARGAINARPPAQGRKQVAFKLDYKGGWGFFRDAKYWKKRFGRNVCGRYKGPRLPWLVDACTMRDGSHWAVQSWQRRLRTYGHENPGPNRVWELRLSHWRGELPVLEIKMDWQSWGDRSEVDPFGDRHYDHLWGRYTYRGHPVYGFESTRYGAPLDSWGRNVYLDTFNSVYGPGWRHENAFLTHDPTGNFCYVVTKHGSRAPGKGEKYRATVVGPGVAPDVIWEGNAPGEYDPVADALANEQQMIDLFSVPEGPRWDGGSKCDVR